MPPGYGKRGSGRRGFGRSGRGRRSGFNREGHAVYRSRSGIFLGVCKGFADYFDTSVFWIRLLIIFLTIFTGFWPMLVLYLLAAAILKPEPVVPFQNEADHEFYDSYASSRSMAVARLKRKFETLDRRIRRMEDKVTSRDYDWERRFSNSE